MGVRFELNSVFGLEKVDRWNLIRTSVIQSRAPGTHCIGGWVGPRAVHDAVVKTRIPRPCQDSNPGSPIVQPVA
jgi:hypothetical protein